MNLLRTVLMTAAGVCLVAIASPAEETTPTADKPDKDGFVSLFDGKDLDGWKVGANANAWKVENGQIVVHGPGPAHMFYVGPVHNHDWKNFHLRAEVMTYPHANSGIYFHTSYQESGWPEDGFEAQVNCTHSDWKKTGSLYAIQDIRDPHQVDNKWFVYDIIVKGDTVTLKIDGTTVNEWKQPVDFKPPADHAKRFLHHGTVALQGHDPGSEVHYKSILIKPLD